jgi:diguanylate cyclase (GGDEF)-like protein
MSAVGGAVTGVVAVVAPVPAGPISSAVSFLVPAMLIVMAGVLLGLGPRWWPIACLIVPLIGVVAVAALDLATRDASAAAQVFLCYPLLYAASRLQPTGAWMVLVVALGADGVVALSLEPAGRAVTDMVYVGATLIALTALLTGAGRHQDQLVARLSLQATVDSLTGLATRRVLDEATRLAMSDSAGPRGTCLLLIDLDRFKAINDTYGHPVGDAALVHVAELVSSHARVDSVIARIGGDELAILLRDCARDVAAVRAEQLVDAVRRTPLVLPSGTVVRLSVSVGVAHVPSTAREQGGLYTAADEALYRAKRTGRDRVSLSNTDLVSQPLW